MTVPDHPAALGRYQVVRLLDDLPTGRTSGLVEAMRVVGNIEGIEFIRFDEKDVVRHSLVQQIVKAYDAYSSGPRQ